MIRQPSIDPFAQLQSRFMGATLEVAQHPSAGMAWVGATAMRLIRTGELEPEAFAHTELHGDAKKDVIAATAAIHRLFKLDLPPGGLNTAIPFAYGLVLNGIVSTASEYAKGDGGAALPNIDLVNEDQRSGFVRLARSPRQLAEFGMVLTAAAQVYSPEGPAQPSVTTYMSTILNIAHRYPHVSQIDERRQAMGEARNELSVDLRPLLEANMPVGAHFRAANIAAANLVRNAPSDALATQYFGQPPA
jgi:hypothetical protein